MFVKLFFHTCRLRVCGRHGSSSTASAEPDNSPITITVLNRVNAEIVLDDNPMLAAVAEKTGVTLEIEAPPISNYTDRLQLVMASGDLPDIIYTWEFDQNYEKWANDGLILPLDEYIEDYPNLMANISEGQWGQGPCRRRRRPDLCRAPSHRQRLLGRDLQ